MMRFVSMLAMSVTLALVGCGYHLVGHGDGDGDNIGGAIPADITTLSLVGNADATLMAQLQQRLHSERFSIVDKASVIEDKAHYAMLHINIAALVFTPSVFDAAGLATQYHMVFSGALRLDRQGEVIWQSGIMQRQDDVFVTGDPTNIEAGRERVLADLKRQWLSDAVGRIRSGF